MAVTLKQIAEKAGVSVATASRILNGRETGVQVREDTRQRVLNAASELRYRPNLLARGLVGSKSSLIGVIVRDISDPYLNKILKGMYQAAVEHKYRLFLGHVGQRTDTTLDYGSMFEQSHADGIIVMGDIQNDSEVLQELTSQHRYLVGVTDRINRRQFPGVYSDSAFGAKLAMDHLFSLGHQQIVCVTDPDISDGKLRAEIYEQQMHQFNLDRNIKTFFVTRSIESGYQIGLWLFSNLEITAIFAGTDTLAIGLIKAAYQLGVEIPKQVSIIGYDDIDMAAYTTPALTTINQSGQEMGYRTTTLLIDMIENELDSVHVDDVVLKPTLIARESTHSVLNP
jgi:LacI family transcriptional regulator